MENLIKWVATSFKKEGMTNENWKSLRLEGQHLHHEMAIVRTMEPPHSRSLAISPFNWLALPLARAL
ncbi:hypothetical protein Leryth_000085 [Lithospermum erythrorhizon]|nr:hypothetical protein Leryth_000085 [Lithospermum erythrorhizon]